MYNDFTTGAGPLLFVVALLFLAVAVFEIAMFIHVIRNKNITGDVKALWILGMLVVHPVVAIVYFFTDYKKV